jgi:hypothetical protein
MTYRVATAPSGCNLWWTEYETIPDGHNYIREATPEEAALMDQILKQDAVGRMPSLAIGDKLRKLLNPEKSP